MASRKQELLGRYLDLAGAASRSHSSKKHSKAMNPSQWVQQFLLNVKIRAMAGDPQAIALLQQYQQIVSSPIAPQPEGSATLPDVMNPAMSMPPPMMPPEDSYPPGMPPQYPQPYPTSDMTPPEPPPAPVAGWSRSQLEGPIYSEQDRLKFLANKYNFHPGQTDREGWNPASLKVMQQKAAKGDKSAFAYLTKLDTYIRDKNWTDDQDPMGENSHWSFVRGLGEEEIALAREGGACERAALRRRF